VQPAADVSHVSELPQDILPSQTLYGRDFDVLRFERAFVESKVVAISGPAGIGKTAFIQHVVGSWEQSTFIETALKADCTKLKYSSKFSLIHELLRELSGHEGNAPGTGEASHADEVFYLRGTDDIRTRCQLVVFDNLETAYSKVIQM
jgi:Ni2+-binding GTPase involved in maturation of urease and hydrogenase